MPELGVGFYPVECGTEPYDQEYFDRFAHQADSDIGRALMRARCDLVERHFDGIEMIDVGIGSGAFIEAFNARGHAAFGYDVNPAGIAWLEQRDLYADPHRMAFDAMSLWDVLEHIPDFDVLLANVRKWVFISLPIFDGPEHVLRSKHYRPAEHCWHFTQEGLTAVMALCGFELVEANTVETQLGREDIGSFVFRRAA